MCIRDSSLRRLATIGDFDTVSGEVTAGAGVTLSSLQQHIREGGWAFGVDLASRDSATIGGMVATNAGGIRVIRYGAMRRQVLGFEAVLADGGIVRRMPGLVKDNTGYDLGQLLAGSEGTLAILTAVRVRLVPQLERRTVALLGVRELAGALEVVAAVRGELPSLEAAEALADRDTLAPVFNRRAPDWATSSSGLGTATLPSSKTVCPSRSSRPCSPA